MKVSTILTGKAVATIKPEASLKELAQKLAELKIGALVVSSNGESIAGIVSERDIVRAISNKFDSFHNLQVKDIMTVDVLRCTKDSTFAELMILMTQKRIRHVPVVDEKGLLLSIVSIGDVVKNHISEIDGERAALIDYVKSAG